ncbi:MAG: transposase [Verrucomicrobia bacterium]|nr:transposase [Verrucomicrobiota bacterium]
MARKLRIQYAGRYHAMNRGYRREPIFQDDADPECFLATLGEICVKTGWQVHAYCLKGNHLHLVVETLQASLVMGMKWFPGTYLQQPVQPAAPVIRASVQRTLQFVDRGWQRQRLLAHGARIRAFESGAGKVARAGAADAGVLVE